MNDQKTFYIRLSLFYPYWHTSVFFGEARLLLFKNRGKIQVMATLAERILETGRTNPIEEIGKLPLWQRILQQQGTMKAPMQPPAFPSPAGIVPVGKMIGEFGKAIVRAPARGATSLMLSGQGKKELIPQTLAEKILYGKNPVHDVAGEGQSFGQMVGLDEKTAKDVGLPIGFGLIASDIVTGGFGKKAVTTGIKALRGGIDDVAKKGIKSLKGSADDVVKNLDITQEARQYKSAEEFVKAQGTPVYHHGATELQSKGGTWFTNNDISAGGARTGAKGRIDAFIDENKLKPANHKQATEAGLYRGKDEMVKNLKSQGFDGVKMTVDGDKHYFIFDESNIKTKSQLTDIWNKAQSPSKTFQGYDDLTTKFLDYSKGKTTLSRQEILDFARRPELKKGEADLLNKLSKDLPEGKLPAQEFADSLRRDLLELRINNPKRFQTEDGIQRMSGSYGFEGVTIDARQRTKTGKNYEEVVFESPITTNGSSHYPNSKNYFAHTRGDEVVEGGKKIWREQEIQSDLLQKEGMDKFANENTTNVYGSLKGEQIPLRGKTWNIVHVKNDGNVIVQAEIPKEKFYNERGFSKSYTFEGKKYDGTVPTETISIKELPDYMQSKIRNSQEIVTKEQKEYGQLSPFTNDRFGERIMRERIREKAQAGYEKYRLPTGETIGKIEGFRSDQWFTSGKGFGNYEKLTPENLKVGMTVETNTGQGLGTTGSDWIITDILDNGRFKAVLKESYNRHLNKIEGYNKSQKILENELLNRAAEIFDLTGKSNPQYRRYSDWGKFLKNKFGGKEVTDPQGNSWMEIDLKKEQGRMPIEAFGMIPLGMGMNERQKEDVKKHNLLTDYAKQKLR